MNVETPDTGAAIRALLEIIEATAPYASDPRRAAVELSAVARGLLLQLDAQAEAIGAQDTAIGAVLVQLDTLDATLQEHAGKLAAHDAYEARIAALEGR